MWEWPTSNLGAIGTAYSAAVYNDGTGDALYISGYIYLSGASAEIPGVGRYDGHTWTNVGGLAGTYARGLLQVFDDGSGPALYVNGGFPEFGGIEARGIARWDGHTWSSVIRGVYPGSEVTAMVVADSARGRSLFVGGDIVNAGGGNVHYVAQLVACPNCYANCDASSTPPALNINDFVCFLQRYAAGDPIANCDGSTQAQSLNINDFVCYLGKYAAGCS